MDKSKQLISYFSLSNLDQRTQNHQKNSNSENRTLPLPKFPTQDYLYQPKPELDYIQNYDPALFPQPGPKTEVNLKTVLTGLAAIITGKNQNPNPNPSSDISFLTPNKDGEIDIHPSVCTPSAPPLLETEALNYGMYRSILQAEPPEWLPDSYTPECMQCNSPFKAMTRGRHHCRFCGGVFCKNCTKGRCLMPASFRMQDPQRVCDSCYERLDPVQGILVNYISNAAQSAKHDVMDWTCARGWLNLPIGLNMEYEIYKSANTLRNYCQVARLNPEKSIPSSILGEAKGLAILTVVKAGAVITYKIGTGLVVSRRADGSWSAPSAILSAGLGWGPQFGGELMDFILVMHGRKAVKAFSSRMHVSLGAGLSVAAGPTGRVLEVDLRAGDRGSGICYTYSCSKGAFVGISLEGNVVATRSETNLNFYGDPYLTTNEILFGKVERPRAAAPLYSALDDLYNRIMCD